MPGFLVAGAARCGVTTLYTHLRAHPQIHMSPVKDPGYFTAQLGLWPGRGPGDDRRVGVTTPDAYRELFVHTGRALAVGEASSDALYYADRTIPLIRGQLGDPRIVLILRDPVDRAFSAFRQQVREGRETLAFGEALAEEDRRIAEGWDSSWHYRRSGFYHDAVAAFQRSFSRVRVYLFEDLSQDPDGLAADLYRFVGVDAGFVAGAAEPLPSGSTPPGGPLVPPVVARFVQGAVGLFAGWLPSRRPEPKTLGWRKAGMRPATREALAEGYRDDIRKLGALLGRDLSHWAPVDMKE